MPEPNERDLKRDERGGEPRLEGGRRQTVNRRQRRRRTRRLWARRRTRAGAGASTREGKGRGARVKEAAVLRNLETNVRQLPGKILLAPSILLPFSIDTHGPIRSKSYQRVVVAFKVGVPLLPHAYHHHFTSFGTRDWELIRCIRQPSLQLSAEYCRVDRLQPFHVPPQIKDRRKEERGVERFLWNCGREE